MAKKKIEELTVEEFPAKKKSLTGVLYVIGSLVLLHIAYLAYRLVIGKWDTNHGLSVVSLAMLGVVASSISSIRNGVVAEIKKRGADG